jgi:tetratricopeptide (TPR) repeat protein
VDEKVFLGSEDGQLFCLDSRTGDLLWQVTLGCDEDPLRTELLFAEGLLLVGTYSGKVGAVRVSAPPEEVESPDTYEQRGDFENAAASCALHGNFRKAAMLYADKMKDPCKAFALYEHAGLFQEAGILARSLDILEEAQRYFQLAGNTKAEAEVALKRGDELTAARLFEQVGELPLAAHLYEEADEFSKAKDIYRQLGDWEALLRLNTASPLSLPEIEVLEKMGKISEAAEAAWKAGALRKAVDLFQRAGTPGRELEILLELVKKEPEKWVFERIAELARKAGRFLDEAQSREQLGKSLATAEAYQRAAVQAEQARPCDERTIAALFEKASHYFNDLDLLDMEQQCLEKVAQYRHLPVVRIDGQTEKDFKELEWNKLELTIRNQGYGLATDVHWRVSTDKFEITDDTSVWEMRRLGEGHQRIIRFDFRPKKGEIGRVPFRLEWDWRSESGEEFHDKLSVSVPVKTRDDTRPTGQPVIFQGGTLIQTEKYIAGDDLAGGQKGDKVEINRGGGVKLTAGQDAMEIQPGRKSADQVCPTCHLPVEADAKVCIYCGNELPAAHTSKRKK